MINKIYTIEVTNIRFSGQRDIQKIQGTLDELIRKYYYILRSGNSYNKKINIYPKTIKSFVKSLQMSFNEQDRMSVDKTFVIVK